MRAIPLCVFLSLATALPAAAAPVRVEGGKRLLTVSGEPLAVYHLVEKGHSLQAKLSGPLMLHLELRRHSRGLSVGKTEAALDLDGAEVDRFELGASPRGRYLGGFGFSPGPPTKRSIQLGPGTHTVRMRALGGAIAVALTSEPMRPAPAAVPLAQRSPGTLSPQPLVSSGPQAAPKSSSKASPGPAAPAAPAAASPPQASPPGERLSEAAAAAKAEGPLEAERQLPGPATEKAPVLVLAIRAGSVSQPQLGSTSVSGGLDLLAAVSNHWRIGVGIDVFDLGLVSLPARVPGAASSLSVGLAMLEVPVYAEAAYDARLASWLIGRLGIGLGGAYVRFDRSASAGSFALATATASGISPLAAALAGLAVPVGMGRVGLGARFLVSPAEDAAGVERATVPGALLGEVSYQIVL